MNQTGVVKDVAGWLQAKYSNVVGMVYIDAAICVSTSDIYQHIIRKLKASFQNERSSTIYEGDEVKNSKQFVNENSFNQTNVIISSSTSLARHLALLLENRTAILIIDNAELLVAFGSSRCRLLTQLMLIPSSVNVNLTVIAITTKSQIGKSPISKCVL